MKNQVSFYVLLFLSLIVIFSSCNKKSYSDKDSFEEEYKYQEEVLIFDNDDKYEKVIVSPIVKLDDCKFIVAGIIEYHKGDKVIAVVDYGDGTCDNLATKTVDGKTYEFELDSKGSDDKYNKVITEPIIKLDDCIYIVAGIIELYEGDKWVASIDFGDGICDEWATKTWDGGSKVFSMAKN